MKTEEWFQNINWSGECLQCKAKHGGECPMRECAESNYDQNGNKIPLYVYHADGNTLEKYLNSQKEGKGK